MATVKITFNDTKARQFLSLLSDKKKWIPVLKALVTTVGFKNVIKHFQDEEGPRMSWPKRKESTQSQYAKRGKRSAVYNPSNKLLQLTGHLRQNFRVSNVRTSSDSATLFNPVKYAHRHDKGTEGMPKRQFMWLDNDAKELISKGFWTKVMEGQGFREFD